jgi:hypothetical protein
MLSVDWSSLPVPVPENIGTYSVETQKLIFEYLSQLETIQQRAYLIAKDHLGTSFDILRSTGYSEWIKSKSKS